MNQFDPAPKNRIRLNSNPQRRQPGGSTNPLAVTSLIFSILSWIILPLIGSSPAARSAAPSRPRTEWGSLAAEWRWPA